MRQLYQHLPVTWKCSIKPYLLENCNVARPLVVCMRNDDKKPCIELARIRRIDICIYCRYRSAISSIEEASLHVTVFELFQLMLLLFLLISSFHHCTFPRFVPVVYRYDNTGSSYLSYNFRSSRRLACWHHHQQTANFTAVVNSRIGNRKKSSKRH